MKFSVLLSVYKKEKKQYFQQALESILNQTLLPSEIVVVKDGYLTTELNEVCLTYERKHSNLIRFVQLEKNQGLGTALRLGLNYCTYDIIARMDTDDIARSDRFEKQIREFEKDRNLAILGSAIEEFSTIPTVVNTIRNVPLLDQEIIEYAKKRNPFNHMTVMFRKKAVLSVGSYQPFYSNEDYYLWFRLLNKGYKAKNLSECLVSVRVDKNFFKRRGGVKYFFQEIKLQKIFYQSGFIDFFECMRNIIIRMIARVVPNIIRECLYKKYMRK
ncbi:glycosyltransferase [Propionispira raffinosivorans]|uniref:glycosyltransferase n=1 Tax=Propionispira raffinosivorans TaxID=86959 RepID=UPI00037828E5|nr:glycosyltransferase [Propionispira raffinosivorans]